MAIESIQEVIDYVSQNKENQELTSALEKTGVVKTVEVIKEKEFSDEELYNKFVGKQNLKDKLINDYQDKFIGKTLGVDTKELTDEHRKLELIPKTEYEKVTNEFNMFKNQTIVKSEFGDNFELLEKHIDYSQELEPQIESIKTKFSKLFSQEPQGKLNDNSSKPIQQKDKKTQMEELLKTAKKGGIEGKKALTEWTRLQNSL